jgi:glutamate---cysteine ligase / carboxylate-amine ligase
VDYQQPGALRLFGVEEELLLVDSSTFKPSPAAQSAIARQSGATATSSLELELQQEQIEVVNTPCSSMEEVLSAIRQGRTLADEAARKVGARAVAMATCASAVLPHTVPTTRYLAMKSGFGRTLRDQLTCGYHVHVQVGSAEEGVAVLDRIRIWLPVLLALSANSPFWSGTDSDFASYRHQLWNRWPTSGPNEIFGSATAYRREVARLLETGVPMDEGMIYFDARLSRNHPTVEVRIADVCLEAEHAAAIAALVRALVETAAREWAAGIKPRPAAASHLRLAGWRASKSGVEDELVHPLSNRPRDAATVITALLDHVHEALAESGEEVAVARVVGRILASGTGATAQRRAAASEGSLAGVVAHAVELTHRDAGIIASREPSGRPAGYRQAAEPAV